MVGSARGDAVLPGLRDLAQVPGAATACLLASMQHSNGCTEPDSVMTPSLACCRTSNTNGLSRSSEELRADPNALANGAFDAPSKLSKGRKAEAVPGGPSSSDLAVAGKLNMRMHFRCLLAHAPSDCCAWL